MSRRVRRVSGFKIKGIVIFICIVLFLCSAGMIVFLIQNAEKKAEQIYVDKINELQNRLDLSARKVLIAKDYIASGTVLDSTMVEEKEVVSDFAGFATEADFGKLVLNDIQKGSEITKQAIRQEGTCDDIREVEMDFVKISEYVNEGDYTDLRLRFPDGTDYIIASKKKILRLDKGKNMVVFHMNEEEILLMDSAMTDMNRYNDSECYMTKYINPEEDAASIVNYSPSESLYYLILDNPNILNISNMYISCGERDKIENSLKKLQNGTENGDENKNDNTSDSHDNGGSIWD